MAEFEEGFLEQILTDLDGRGALFPRYGLTKEKNGLKFLGGGGFSFVYEMYDKEDPALKCVLKVTGYGRHTVSSEKFWETVRIQQFLCQESDHVVGILDAKELTERGIRLQFILMEKLDGVLRKDRFHKVSLTRPELTGEPEVIRFALQIGQGLYAAHSEKILHRDVKLENIFWDEEAGRYKLGDLGVARYTEDGGAETCVYTDGYGAPEIELGVDEAYGVTADIYSFGITCYLLLNDLRFPGSEGYYPKAEVQYDPDYVFPAPAHASVEMTRIIRRMCSYRPQDRYQSVAELLPELVLASRAAGQEIPEELAVLPDVATETYRGESGPEEAGAEGDAPDEGDWILHPRTRAERKLYRKAVDEIYREESIKYAVIITILLTLLMRAMPTDVSLAIPQIVGVFGVLIGCPLLTASAVLACGCWTVLSVVLKLSFLDFLADYDLGWLALLAVLLAVNRYFQMRIVWEKTTYKRAWLGKFIYDKLFLVMIAAGVGLWLLQQTAGLTIPETVRRLHPVRTGALGFAAMVFLAWWDDDSDEDVEEKADGADT